MMLVVIVKSLQLGQGGQGKGCYDAFDGVEKDGK